MKTSHNDDEPYRQVVGVMPGNQSVTSPPSLRIVQESENRHRCHNDQYYAFLHFLTNHKDSKELRERVKLHRSATPILPLRKSTVHAADASPPISDAVYRKLVKYYYIVLLLRRLYASYLTSMECHTGKIIFCHVSHPPNGAYPNRAWHADAWINITGKEGSRKEKSCELRENNQQS